MMKVQLLLLLALVGPFCDFTRASPTELPSPDEVTTGDTIIVTTEASDPELTVVTRPAPTDPVALPEVVTEVVETEATTEGPPPSTPVLPQEPAVETEAPVASTAAPEPEVTDAPALETLAPTVKEEDEVQTATPDVVEEEVMVEDGTEEGLSSGQVVGIVIGALLAVIIVIAVVIAVVRRMGKYSTAKSKKPAKKDSVMVSPLRKKPSKQQQQRSKFWKF